MRNLEYWLTTYGESHQNVINKRIHWVCVPVIAFSLVGLLWSIPHGFDRSLPIAAPFFNWGTLFLAFASLYYLMLSRSLFVGMLVVSVLLSLGNYWLSRFEVALWKSSLTLFILAWIGQFIGHKIEGKKPSFFQDIQFLLIGPAWCLSFLYRKLGLPVAVVPEPIRS